MALKELLDLCLSKSFLILFGIDCPINEDDFAFGAVGYGPKNHHFDGMLGGGDDALRKESLAHSTTNKLLTPVFPDLDPGLITKDNSFLPYDCPMLVV